MSAVYHQRNFECCCYDCASAVDVNAVYCCYFFKKFRRWFKYFLRCVTHHIKWYVACMRTFAMSVLQCRNLFITTILFGNYGLNWRYHFTVRIKYELRSKIEWAMCIHTRSSRIPWALSMHKNQQGSSTTTEWYNCQLYLPVMISWLTKNWQFDVGNISIFIYFYWGS